MSVPPDLAQRLRRLSQRIDRDREERNRLIIDAHNAGASLREIEAVAGITHVAVLRIIRRHQ